MMIPHNYFSDGPGVIPERGMQPQGGRVSRLYSRQPADRRHCESYRAIPSVNCSDEQGLHGEVYAALSLGVEAGFLRPEAV